MDNTEILEEIKKIQESLSNVADSLGKVEKYLLRADLSLVGENKDIVSDPKDAAEDEIIDDIDDTVPSRIDKGIMNEPNYFGGALPADETNYEIGPETPIENNNSRQPVDVNLNNDDLFSDIIDVKRETKENPGIGFKEKLQSYPEPEIVNPNNSQIKQATAPTLPTFDSFDKIEIDIVNPNAQAVNQNSAVAKPSPNINNNFENYEPSFDFVKPDKTINPNQGPAPISVNPMNYSDKVDVPNMGNNINQN